MVAPNASTFDLATSRRPGTDDFNGIAKVDDAAYQPDPTTQPNAAEWNTIEWLLLAVCRVMPVMVLSITGGNPPTLANFLTAPKNIIAGNLTITRVGAGNVQITWPAGKFPPSASPPIAGLNSGGSGMIDAVVISNGVQVRTYNAAGAATDLSFTVSVY